MIDSLHHTYEIMRKNGTEISDEVPYMIKNNLNKKLSLRTYQNKAIANSIFYFKMKHRNRYDGHVIYHMATGSGKTLLMATNILHLYSLGYRNFMFFVNSTNVLSKTRDNFLNPDSIKYLFSEKIEIENKIIKINSVENFESLPNDDINILFTTIQNLHMKLQQPVENGITWGDFTDKKIVMISDEAHHINSSTKQLTIKESNDQNTWENTIKNIFDSNTENVLLEYTATLDLNNEQIKKKYHERIIYDYTLKEFRNDGYSKEIQMLQSDVEPFKRSLQAIILSQYRYKVAERHNIRLKPVVLIKSKSIKESENFKKEFYEKLENLTPSDLKKIEQHTKSTILKNAFVFIKTNNIKIKNFIKELKIDFSEEKSVILNTKSIEEEKQILVNTLEAENNNIRIIFVVDMLNEGWDVLNLFDIVKAYDSKQTQNVSKSSKIKPKHSTISEAQLIGRGARYCPFEMENSDDKFKRKFDHDLDNEVRILEELYYHSKTNSRYIEELKMILEAMGIYNNISNRVKMKIKPSFMDTQFWKKGEIYLNKKITNKRENIDNFNDIKMKKIFKYRLNTGYTVQGRFFDGDFEKKELLEKTIILNKIEKNIVRKSIHMHDFYKFSNIQKYFPKLTSMEEFYKSIDFLGCIKIQISGNNDQLDEISVDDKLDMVNSALYELSIELQHTNSEYIGTDEFYPFSIKDKIKDRKINFKCIADNGGVGFPMSKINDDDLHLNLKDKEWYVYDDSFGTTEEKYFIKLIFNKMSELQKRYKDVYLIRNEKAFKIYRFSDGHAFEPDFVLFLTDKSHNDSLIYQIFIEPKGDQLLKMDEWKEEFLKEIKKEFRTEVIMNNSKIKIIGMPFYNKNNENAFLEKFKSIY